MIYNFPFERRAEVVAAIERLETAAMRAKVSANQALYSLSYRTRRHCAAQLVTAKAQLAEATAMLAEAEAALLAACACANGGPQECPVHRVAR